MADAILSVAVERLAAIIEELIQNEVNLVRGAEKEARSLSSELAIIRNALDDGESRRFKDKNLNNWLSKLENIAYEMEDVLDEWSFTIRKLKVEEDESNDDAVVAPKQKKVCSFIPSSSCFSFKKVVVRREIAIKIKAVKEKLDELLKEKDKYKSLLSQPTNQIQLDEESKEIGRYDFVQSGPSTDHSADQSWRVQSVPFIDLAKIHGRESDRNTLVSKVMSSGGDQLGEPDSLRILSIVGAGGLGKTTLAQLLYNHDQVEKSFEIRIWICVSDPFNEVAIAKGIIESVEEGSSPNTKHLPVLCKHLIESVKGKKFFLVLDDVWSNDYKKWEPLINSLKYGGKGSVILVTTRNQEVAQMMSTTETDIHGLGQLSNDDCWLLLSDIALSARNNKENREKFRGIGNRIVEKCKGLPLAVKILGSLLRSKNSLEEWEDVLSSKIWELEIAEVELFPHLLLSYNKLSPALKRCFSYCAFFPKDTVIEVEEIIGMWTAQGYLSLNMKNVGDVERKGRDNFDILARHSLFQDLEKDKWGEKIVSFKMHDIVHDFARFVRKNSSRVEVVGVEETTCKVCDPLLVSNVKEYRSLFLKAEKIPQKFCDCLKSVRVLRLSWGTGIPQGIENLVHLRWLNLNENKLSVGEDTKPIFKLFNLQFLWLSKCDLQEVSREIGNLIYLRLLDVSDNRSLKELPDSICGLHELQTLNLDENKSLGGLPEGIHRLINLKHLHNRCSPKQFSQGLAQLTSLRTLSQFYGGRGLSKLRWLKDLNRLSGTLNLYIKLSTNEDDYEVDVVGDAREAELRNKIHIQLLRIRFVSEMDEREASSTSVSTDVLDALEPHQNLRQLLIWGYRGSKFPDWIASLNQLRRIGLYETYNVSSVSPLGKLPCLEHIYISKMLGLQVLGREFLGMTEKIESSSSSKFGASATNTTIVFPKLKELTFSECYNWKEWEDITVEEEEEDSTIVSLMPCLTKLNIRECPALMVLPHRLLRKASSLEELNITDSTQLEQRYLNTRSSASKYPNPHFQFRIYSRFPSRF